MFRNRTASQHNFAVVPRADIPRSKFKFRQNRKQAFNASELIPIMCEEVLPGDVWQHKESIAARLATPIAPLLDDMDLETFYFFNPNRIVSEDWEDFITGQDPDLTTWKIKPGIYGVNQSVVAGGVFDHFGILPQNYTPYISLVAYPFVGMFKIWNDWFRDQNLQEEWVWPTTALIDSAQITQDSVPWDQMPLRVNKRPDYFTKSLPWPQKGDPVELPLGSTAPVIADPITTNVPVFTRAGITFPGPTSSSGIGSAASANMQWAAGAASGAGGPFRFGATTGLVTDLSEATAATINSLRIAFQTQKLLERDARGGSRYVEQILSHFGTRSPDYRLQRPEYLGGSKIPITINPIAQTAAYDAEPATAASAIGNLGAEMHASGSRGTFTYAATEHGWILGFAVVRSTPQYQQGTRRHFLRDTRLDYFFPVFSMLGEQAVETREIYQTADNTYDNSTWGYQERWAEYRYTPNEITGFMRSTYAQPLDWWHLSEEFADEPALNADFITDKTQETLARALATAPSAQWSTQIIMDIAHTSIVARMMPTYSVPGLIDHF